MFHFEVAALGTELIGVPELVGAFLAGLAISATLLRQSPVIGHVLFMVNHFLSWSFCFTVA